MHFNIFKLYGVVCFFPVWVFRTNFEIYDILILIFFFLFLPTLFHIIIFKSYYKIKPKTIYFWLSLITFYCLDQNLGLWTIAKNGFSIINFDSPYLNSSFFSIISVFFLYLLFLLIKRDAVKIIFSSIFVILLFNVLDTSKNYVNFPKIDLIENKQVVQNDLNKKIVLIFDEMSGFNSIDSNVDNGKIINQKIKEYFIINNFDIYENAHALFRDTDQSLGSTLNFIKTKEEYVDIDINKEVHFINKSNNYFTTNKLEQNKFFDLNNHKNIVVNQSMYIDYCRHPKVIICNQFNPFDKNLTFINGFKSTKISKYVSAYRNNGSIFSYFFWRMVSQIRLVDTFLDPDGEKASIRYIFDQIFENILINKDTSLFFSHILVPHIPYAFNQECEYDGNRTLNYNRISFEKKRIQHNLEKACLIKYLDEFFMKIKKIRQFENFEIIIFSDHDSRIEPLDNIRNNVVFLHKKKNSKISKSKNNEISINKLLYDLSID
tara:strand:+ start:291 stop:1760 length:1470 start_codon:yes stop_codon:yes gene_type:complete